MINVESSRVGITEPETQKEANLNPIESIFPSSFFGLIVERDK